MLYRHILLAAFALGASMPAFAAGGVSMELYKNPGCGCCDLWAEHMEANGFKVKTIETHDLQSVEKKYGVPARLAACHTAIVDGYVVEGLVPAKFVQRLLTERPPVKGIALPGMPVGAPGMPGSKARALSIYTLDTAPKIFGNF